MIDQKAIGYRIRVRLVEIEWTPPTFYANLKPNLPRPRSWAYVRSIINGEGCCPRLDFLEAVADTLSMDLAWLLFGWSRLTDQKPVEEGQQEQEKQDALPWATLARRIEGLERKCAWLAGEEEAGAEV